MKVFIMLLMLASCSTHQNQGTRIVVNFLKTELSQKKYERFAGDLCYVVDDSNPLYAINVYEYAFQNKKGHNEWPIDSMQISIIKEKYSKKNYKWQNRDFRDFDFKIIPETTARNITNPQNLKEDDFDSFEPKLLIRITAPHFIDEKHVLLYFQTQKIDLVSTIIDRYVVLLKREGSDWLEVTKYYDGLYH